jgi:hypothetical protein
LIAEETAGCYLDPDEFLVHHKDGERSNNVLENLEVLPYKSHGPGKSADADTVRRMLVALRVNDFGAYCGLVGEIQGEIMTEEAMEAILAAPQPTPGDQESHEELEYRIDTAMTALRHGDERAYQRVLKRHFRSVKQVLRDEHPDAFNPKKCN